MEIELQLCRLSKSPAYTQLQLPTVQKHGSVPDYPCGGATCTWLFRLLTIQKVSMPQASADLHKHVCLSNFNVVASIL